MAWTVDAVSWPRIFSTGIFSTGIFSTGIFSTGIASVESKGHDVTSELSFAPVPNPKVLIVRFGSVVRSVRSVRSVRFGSFGSVRFARL